MFMCFRIKLLWLKIFAVFVQNAPKVVKASEIMNEKSKGITII
jgi:hypothetical protein